MLIWKANTFTFNVISMFCHSKFVFGCLCTEYVSCNKKNITFYLFDFSKFILKSYYWRHVAMIG